MENVFINREEELNRLHELYNSFLKGARIGVLVYGLRRVGKTRLIQEFIKDKASIEVNCAFIGDAKQFYNKILTLILERFNPPDEWIKKVDNIMNTISSEIGSYEYALNMLVKISEMTNLKIVAFLDEFHLFLDKLSVKVAREEKTNKKRATLDLLWVLKSVVDKGRVFFILSSSLGWEKIQELMQRKTKEHPLLGIFERIEVKPLSKEDTIKLARAYNEDLTEEQLISIAEISGGIPKIVISIAIRAKRNESIANLAVKMLKDGEFDDFFENLIKLIDEVIPYDYPLIISVLLKIAEGIKTAKEISSSLKIDERIVRGVLLELVKSGLLKRTNKRPTEYDITYPLLSTWLLIKESRKVFEKIYESSRLMSLLGLTAESYIRELLTEAVGRRIVIYEDEKGTYFCGTVDKLELNLKRILGKKDTDIFFSKLSLRNSDIVAYEEDRVILFEVKAGIKEPKLSDIMDLFRVVESLKRRGLNALGIIIYLNVDMVPHRIVAEATRKRIIIMTNEAIRSLARKVEFPKV